MKEFIRRGLYRLGFDLVRIEHSHGNLARHIGRVLRDKSIDCVLDVGANIGQYGRFLRSLGYEGYILSFEPVESVFRELEMNSKHDKRWKCFSYALGDKNECKQLNVYESTVFSSFLVANDYSKKRWHTSKVTTQEVVVHKLEDVWPELVGHLGCSSYMLKLDTQGFDKYVFDGAVGCLDQISVLQSELALIPVYEGMLQVYDILRQYNKHDFFISGMYPVNRDPSLAVVEYDCVMVKTAPPS